MVKRHGATVWDDRVRGRALIADVCAGYKLEANLLGCALDEGVPAELSLSCVNEKQRSSLVLKLAARLVRRRGLEPALALWATESWRTAVDGVYSA